MEEVVLSIPERAAGCSGGPDSGVNRIRPRRRALEGGSRVMPNPLARLSSSNTSCCWLDNRWGGACDNREAAACTVRTRFAALGGRGPTAPARQAANASTMGGSEIRSTATNASTAAQTANSRWRLGCAARTELRAHDHRPPSPPRQPDERRVGWQCWVGLEARGSVNQEYAATASLTRGCARCARRAGPASGRSHMSGRRGRG